MRPLRIISAVVASVAALAVAATASGAPAPAPERVQVRGSEFDLTLSKQKLLPGRAIVQFLNGGEDAHDLRLQRVGATGQKGPELSIGVVGPGAYENLDADLRRHATYVMWCSLSDHRERGMEAVLRTKKRQS